jgi:hypothetical protein
LVRKAISQRLAGNTKVWITWTDNENWKHHNHISFSKPWKYQSTLAEFSYDQITLDDLRYNQQWLRKYNFDPPDYFFGASKEMPGLLDNTDYRCYELVTSLYLVYYQKAKSDSMKIQIAFVHDNRTYLINSSHFSRFYDQFNTLLPCYKYVFDIIEREQRYLGSEIERIKLRLRTEADEYYDGDTLVKIPMSQHPGFFVQLGGETVGDIYFCLRKVDTKTIHYNVKLSGIGDIIGTEEFIKLVTGKRTFISPFAQYNECKENEKKILKYLKDNYNDDYSDRNEENLEKKRN